MTSAEDLKSRVDCRDIVRMLWGQPKRSTPKRDIYFSRWRNDGHKASFKVTFYGYRDFGGTGDKGSALDFLMRELNLSFGQAVEWLQNYTHSNPDVTPRRQYQERPATNEPPSTTWQNTAISFIEASQRELQKNEAVLKYLHHERLLTDETIKAAGLGWNPQARKISGQYWVEAGIVIPRYQDGTLWFVNVRTVTGSFAAYLGIADYTRFNSDALDKYMCMGGSKLIGSLHYMRKPRPGIPTLFVEGEFDCILAQQEFGDTVNAVTLGGATNRITSSWKNRILELNTPIYIALDNDSAGTDATRHLITEFGERATTLRYPTGYKDFTDCINAGMDAHTWYKAQTNQRVFVDGAPVTWVSAMMMYMRPGTAFLFVAIQEAARSGAIDPECFSAPDLYQWMQENGFPIAQKTFYRYLESCEGELLSKRNILSNPNTGKNSVLQNDNNSRGRPADAYCLSESPHLRKKLLKQARARLYDTEFKSDGKRGIKARPRIAGLIRLGILNATAVAAGLDKAYQPIHQRQRWAHVYAEKRIQRKQAEIVADLADLTPLKTAGHLIKRQSDLEPCIIETRLKEGVPTSQKEIGEWIGKDRSHVGSVLSGMGYQGYEPPRQIIPCKLRQNIKQAAIEACPSGRWVGLLIDDNPKWQPFEQAVANQAKQSVAMVIQPPNAYKYVAVPVESAEKVAKPKGKKIEVEQSKAAHPYKPAPYFGDDVNPEVDHNQHVLGLTLTGWEYNQDAGFWYNPASGQYCRTIIEAVLLQAGVSGENEQQEAS